MTVRMKKKYKNYAEETLNQAIYTGNEIECNKSERIKGIYILNSKFCLNLLTNFIMKPDVYNSKIKNIMFFIIKFKALRIQE